MLDKEHIVAEIKRTAAMNRGKPLGMDRFLEETGIHRSDWLGKYWAKWSDALQEAGLQPNAFGAEASSQPELLRPLADLTKRLGRIPAKSEMELERRNGGSISFPSVYQRRLGSRQTQVSLLRTFCLETGGYDDVVAVCDDYLETKQSASNDLTPRQNTSETIGYVYLIKMGRYYKIGRTNSIGRRERELAIQLPESPRTVHVLTTDDPSGIESYWHNRFRESRVNGEFFALSPSDVAAFRRRKFM